MSVPVPVKTEEVILENAEYNSAEELEEELQLQLEDSGGEGTTSYHIQYANESGDEMGTPGHQRTRSGGMNTSGGSGSKTPQSLNGGNGNGGSNKNMLESEKRMRREIANSNERRRMQSINAGFQNLRSLLPRHEGDKLSKAAILQQTSQYICELENQKTQLLAQNSQLKRQLGQHESNLPAGGGSANDGNADNNTTTTTTISGVTIKKRKLTADNSNMINIQTISDSSDEGLGSMSPEPMTLLNAAAAAAAGGGGAGGGGTAKSAAAFIAAHKELADTKKSLDKERHLRNLLEEELQKIKRQLFSVATAPPATSSVTHVSTSSGGGGGSSSIVGIHSGGNGGYIPHEVIEHTDNIVLRCGSDQLDDLPLPLPAGSVSYVEIDEMTGQQQVVVCSSIEELESEAAAAAAEIIAEDENVHEEVILGGAATPPPTSSTSLHHHHHHHHHSGESAAAAAAAAAAETVNINAIAKAYAEGGSPSASAAAAALQPILHAAMKAKPKVEVERINEAIMRVKTEKIEQPCGLTRSRQNLETIVEAIRHLEGDHLFGEVQQHLPHGHKVVGGGGVANQESPLALTTGGGGVKSSLAGQSGVVQRSTTATLNELRPFLQLKANKQLTIVGGGCAGLTLTPQSLAAAKKAAAAQHSGAGANSATTTVTPTAIFKVQTVSSGVGSGGDGSSIGGNATTATGNSGAQQVTISSASFKQCRPGVIVAKKLS